MTYEERSKKKVTYLFRKKEVLVQNGYGVIIPPFYYFEFKKKGKDYFLQWKLDENKPTIKTLKAAVKRLHQLL